MEIPKEVVVKIVVDQEETEEWWQSDSDSSTVDNFKKEFKEGLENTLHELGIAHESIEVDVTY